ncbi:nuclear transport factor 2 family protein [Mycolicibacterium sp. 050232]|uniref:nuclear transport factor 2 family protein n=1 Tax=Mycolicibacterium sp. 050232 TaxID=3113982 RepID=UPI002E295102|nr:nuclear transport factor 2 family protein [Mycolicibacterium sp. 050232]MED5813643.1 nuclear transport factor 2 family protein [Mycolicibacterium sp. 050232]
MTIDATLGTLQRNVRYLLDRTEILDCVARHARGCDRHDIDLITAAYHPDGVDEHGHAVNAGPEYGGWANATHAETSRVHTHNITTHTCETAGDTAHAESYVIVVLIGTDGKSAQFITGRYIDRLERRDGQWRIAVRRSTVEGMFLADARVLQSSFFTEKGYLVGTRDRTDLSYQRPLTIETPAPARW